jgi:hypothetical protein
MELVSISLNCIQMCGKNLKFEGADPGLQMLEWR